MKALTGRIIVMAIGLLGLVGCAGDRPDNLGAQDGLLAPCPNSPNCVSSQANDERHRIAPLLFSGDPAADICPSEKNCFQEERYNHRGGLARLSAG